VEQRPRSWPRIPAWWRVWDTDPADDVPAGSTFLDQVVLCTAPRFILFHRGMKATTTAFRHQTRDLAVRT
jgi:hypothetical protein